MDITIKKVCTQNFRRRTSVRDSSGNTFLRHEKKIAADIPVHHGGHALKKLAPIKQLIIKIKNS